MITKSTKMQLDIIISPEEKDGAKVYNISCMQVPNVVTQGETIEEAKQMLKEALELYFEEAPEEKEKIIQTLSFNSNIHFFNTTPFSPICCSEITL